VPLSPAHSHRRLPGLELETSRKKHLPAWLSGFLLSTPELPWSAPFSKVIPAPGPCQVGRRRRCPTPEGGHVLCLPGPIALPLWPGPAPSSPQLRQLFFLSLERLPQGGSTPNQLGSGILH